MGVDMRTSRTVTVVIACGFALALAGCGGSRSEAASVARADDYLSPELRAAVEDLKRDVNGSPTTERTASERAIVTYDWVNAYALAGGYVPVEATSLLARILSQEASAGPQLDLLVAELTIHDENPDAIGTLRADGGPFEVAQPATFTQTYQVGTAPVRAGGGFLVAQHFQVGADHQATDPAADNYVTITSSNPGVRFEADTFSVSGMHGGFRGAAPQLVFRVAEGELAPGDQVTIIYGETSGGSSGLMLPEFVSDEMPFPIYLDLDGSNLWYSLPLQPIRVLSGPVAGVHGFAPSIVATGENFELSIRAEDAFGNRARGDIPAWQLLLGGQVVREVPAGTEGIVVLDGLKLDEPGVHRFSIRSAEGHYRGTVNPVLVQDAPDERIYWGDTHGHSGFAEGAGTADAYMRFARDDARLDYVTHSEHDLWMDAAEWETLRRKVQEYKKEGRFVTFLGYEWTMRQDQGGHHNVLFRNPEDREALTIHRYPTLTRLYHGLRERYDVEDVVVIPHAHQKGEYRLSDPDLEPLLEIMSMHGTFEWFGRAYLAHGHQIGFIAASDDHLGRPGYATPRSTSLAQRGGLGAVFADERTTDAIFDAMRALRTYATTGDRIILETTVNGTGMGDRAPYTDRRVVRGAVHGTAPIDTVTIVRNGKEIWEHSYREQGPVRGAVEATVSFWSDSYPFHVFDNPRGWRHWRGTLRVENARLVDARLVDRQNVRVQHLESLPNDDHTLRFATITRGDVSSIDLELEDVGENTRVVIQLEDATETGSGPPIRRRHQTIEGASVVLPVAELKDGKLERSLEVDGYDDRITLSAGRHEGPMDVEFQFEDTERPRHGDYYYVRVRQVDQAMAWSSPIWIGGYPPR